MNKAEAIARVAAILRSKTAFTFAEFVTELQAMAENRQARLVEVIASGNREATWKILTEVVRKLEIDKAKDAAKVIVTNNGISLADLDRVL